MNKIKKPYGKTVQTAFATVCLLCLLLTFGTVMSSAQGNAKITSTSCTVTKDTTASVTFELQDNPGIYSIILKVEYDASVLTLKSVTNGSVFPESEVVLGSLDANPFTYTGYVPGVDNITANGSILTLNFTVDKDAAPGTYPVKVTQATGYNDSYNKFNIEYVNGSVTVETDTEDTTTSPDASDTTTFPDTSDTVVPSENDPDDTKPKSNTPLIIIIVIVAVVLAGGATAVILILKRRKK